jgi:hypothetical protein
VDKSHDKSHKKIILEICQKGAQNYHQTSIYQTKR